MAATINYERINWEDLPEKTTPINAENLNKMDEAIAGLYHDLESVNFTEIAQHIAEIERSLASETYVYSTDGNGNVFFAPSVAQAPSEP